MIIALNYLIFLFAILLSADLFRRPRLYQDAAIHLSLFAIAALLGGLAHHLAIEKTTLQHWIEHFNIGVPFYFQISTLTRIETRVWLMTFLLVGLTEYYFMRIFLHPVAENLKLPWIKKILFASLIVFACTSLLFGDYAIVVTYHLITHTTVIVFSLYLIISKSLQSLWWLIGLTLFNLTTGAIWALMALSLIPSGPLHYNDWYHLAILLFLFFLHQTITQGSLITTLAKINNH